MFAVTYLHRCFSSNTISNYAVLFAEFVMFLFCQCYTSTISLYCVSFALYVKLKPIDKRPRSVEQRSLRDFAA